MANREVLNLETGEVTELPMSPEEEADLAAQEAAAEAASIKMQTEKINREIIEQRGETALLNNKTYLEITAPSNVQVRDQVAALTRQMNGLIRLVSSRLDSPD